MSYNKKLLNTQIEALTSEHGAEIVEFYHMQGFRTRSLKGCSSLETNEQVRFYGSNGAGLFVNRLKVSSDSDIKTITLEEARKLVEGKTFPRMMWVKDKEDESYKFQRIVIGKVNELFICCLCNVKDVRDLTIKDEVLLYEQAKEIEEEEKPDNSKLLNELIEEARVHKAEVNRLTKKSDKVEKKLRKARKLKYIIQKEIKQLKNN